MAEVVGDSTRIMYRVARSASRRAGTASKTLLEGSLQEALVRYRYPSTVPHCGVSAQLAMCKVSGFLVAPCGDGEPRRPQVPSI